MNRDQDTPNQAANKSKAEGERWTSDSETVERRDRSDAGMDDSGGITNRPLDQEMDNQDRLPDRGESREGAHAGHGDRERGRNRPDRGTEEER
jgi:hypothetical protein